MSKHSTSVNFVERLENRLMFSVPVIQPDDAAPGFLHSTTQLPVAMSGGAGATVGSKAYFLSGNGGLLQIYNTKTRSWKAVKVPTLPEEGAIVGTSAGTKVFFAGSRVPDSSRNPDNPKNHSLLIYDTVSGRSRIVRIPKDGEWYRILSTGNHLVIDGTDNTTNLLLDYNISNGRWRQLNPPGGSGVNEMTVGNTLLVINGHIETYHFDTRTWTERNIAENPQIPRIQIGIAVIDPIGSGTLYLQYGGASFALGLDTVTGQKFLLGSNPNEVFYGDLHSIGQKFIFAGGTGNSAPNDAVSVSGSSPERYTLSVARMDTAFAAVGNQAIFAGGDSISTFDQISVPNTKPTIYNNVDIYTDLNPGPVLSGNLKGNVGGEDRLSLFNTGDGPLRRGYTIQLYASTDYTLNGAILVGSKAVTSSLAAGTSSTFNVRIEIPASTPAEKYHLVAAVKDVNGKITPIAAEESVFRVGGVKSAQARQSSQRRHSGANYFRVGEGFVR